jgi:hypothetical protein
MADRKRCVFCRREIATDEDWEANATLPSDREDAEAERLGLTKLCWEQEDESCLALLAESRRPTNLESALEQHDALYLAVKEEIERLRGLADGAASKGDAEMYGVRADELQAILAKAEGDNSKLAAVDVAEEERCDALESEGSGE